MILQHISHFEGSVSQYEMRLLGNWLILIHAIIYIAW